MLRARPKAGRRGRDCMGSYHEGRYAEHDAAIAAAVASFNADKAGFIGATAEQAAAIPDLTTALVKAWFLQESGGSDRRAIEAWAVDPAQVNRPGEWDEHKAALGLRRSRHAHEGSAASNIRAAIAVLARKGFGELGQPPSQRPGAVFEGWQVALERYNGRGELTANGRLYRENYAARILARSGAIAGGAGNLPGRDLPASVETPLRVALR